jgi:hypothetical protein
MYTEKLTNAFSRCVEAVSNAEKSTKIALAGSFTPLLEFADMKFRESE